MVTGSFSVGADDGTVRPMSAEEDEEDVRELVCYLARHQLVPGLEAPRVVDEELDCGGPEAFVADPLAEIEAIRAVASEPCDRYFDDPDAAALCLLSLRVDYPVADVENVERTYWGPTGWVPRNGRSTSSSNPSCSRSKCRDASVTFRAESRANVVRFLYRSSDSKGRGMRDTGPGKKSWFRIYPASLRDNGDGTFTATARFKNWRKSYGRAIQIGVVVLEAAE